MGFNDCMEMFRVTPDQAKQLRILSKPITRARICLAESLYELEALLGHIKTSNGVSENFNFSSGNVRKSHKFHVSSLTMCIPRREQRDWRYWNLSRRRRNIGDLCIHSLLPRNSVFRGGLKFSMPSTNYSSGCRKTEATSLRRATQVSARNARAGLSSRALQFGQDYKLPQRRRYYRPSICGTLRVNSSFFSTYDSYENGYVPEPESIKQAYPSNEAARNKPRNGSIDYPDAATFSIMQSKNDTIDDEMSTPNLVSSHQPNQVSQPEIESLEKNLLTKISEGEYKDTRNASEFPEEVDEGNQFMVDPQFDPHQTSQQLPFYTECSSLKKRSLEQFKKMPQSAGGSRSSLPNLPRIQAQSRDSNLFLAEHTISLTPLHGERRKLKFDACDENAEGSISGVILHENESQGTSPPILGTDGSPSSVILLDVEPQEPSAPNFPRGRRISTHDTNPTLGGEARKSRLAPRIFEASQSRRIAEREEDIASPAGTQGEDNVKNMLQKCRSTLTFGDSHQPTQVTYLVERQNRCLRHDELSGLSQGQYKIIEDLNAVQPYVSERSSTSDISQQLSSEPFLGKKSEEKVCHTVPYGSEGRYSARSSRQQVQPRSAQMQSHMQPLYRDQLKANGTRNIETIKRILADPNPNEMDHNREVSAVRKTMFVDPVKSGNSASKLLPQECKSVAYYIVSDTVNGIRSQIANTRANICAVKTNKPKFFLHDKQPYDSSFLAEGKEPRFILQNGESPGTMFATDERKLKFLLQEKDLRGPPHTSFMEQETQWRLDLGEKSQGRKPMVSLQNEVACVNICTAEANQPNFAFHDKQSPGPCFLAGGRGARFIVPNTESSVPMFISDEGKSKFLLQDNELQGPSTTGFVEGRRPIFISHTDEPFVPSLPEECLKSRFIMHTDEPFVPSLPEECRESRFIMHTDGPFVPSLPEESRKSGFIMQDDQQLTPFSTEDERKLELISKGAGEKLQHDQAQTVTYSIMPAKGRNLRCTDRDDEASRSNLSRKSMFVIDEHKNPAASQDYQRTFSNTNSRSSSNSMADFDSITHEGSRLSENRKSKNTFEKEEDRPSIYQRGSSVSGQVGMAFQSLHGYDKAASNENLAPPSSDSLRGSSVTHLTRLRGSMQNSEDDLSEYSEATKLLKSRIGEMQKLEEDDISPDLLLEQGRLLELLSQKSIPNRMPIYGTKESGILAVTRELEARKTTSIFGDEESETPPLDPIIYKKRKSKITMKTDDENATTFSDYQSGFPVKRTISSVNPMLEFSSIELERPHAPKYSKSMVTERKEVCVPSNHQRNSNSAQKCATQAWVPGFDMNKISTKGSESPSFPEQYENGSTSEPETNRYDKKYRVNQAHYPSNEADRSQTRKDHQGVSLFSGTLDNLDNNIVFPNPEPNPAAFSIQPETGDLLNDDSAEMLEGGDNLGQTSELYCVDPRADQGKWKSETFNTPQQSPSEAGYSLLKKKSAEQCQEILQFEREHIVSVRKPSEVQPLFPVRKSEVQSMDPNQIKTYAGHVQPISCMQTYSNKYFNTGSYGHHHTDSQIFDLAKSAMGADQETGIPKASKYMDPVLTEDSMSQISLQEFRTTENYVSPDTSNARPTNEWNLYRNQVDRSLGERNSIFYGQCSAEPGKTFDSGNSLREPSLPYEASLSLELPIPYKITSYSIDGNIQELGNMLDAGISKKRQITQVHDLAGFKIEQVLSPAERRKSDFNVHYKGPKCASSPVFDPGRSSHNVRYEQERGRNSTLMLWDDEQSAAVAGERRETQSTSEYVKLSAPEYPGEPRKSRYNIKNEVPSDLTSVGKAGETRPRLREEDHADSSPIMAAQGRKLSMDTMLSARKCSAEARNENPAASPDYQRSLFVADITRPNSSVPRFDSIFVEYPRISQGKDFRVNAGTEDKSAPSSVCSQPKTVGLSIGSLNEQIEGPISSNNKMGSCVIHKSSSRECINGVKLEPVQFPTVRKSTLSMRREDEARAPDDQQKQPYYLPSSISRRISQGINMIEPNQGSTDTQFHDIKSGEGNSETSVPLHADGRKFRFIVADKESRIKNERYDERLVASLDHERDLSLSFSGSGHSLLWNCDGFRVDHAQVPKFSDSTNSRMLMARNDEEFTAPGEERRKSMTMSQVKKQSTSKFTGEGRKSRYVLQSEELSRPTRLGLSGKPTFSLSKEEFQVAPGPIMAGQAKNMMLHDMGKALSAPNLFGDRRKSRSEKERNEDLAASLDNHRSLFVTEPTESSISLPSFGNVSQETPRMSKNKKVRVSSGCEEEASSLSFVSVSSQSKPGELSMGTFNEESESSLPSHYQMDSSSTHATMPSLNSIRSEQVQPLTPRNSRMGSNMEQDTKSYDLLKKPAYGLPSNSTRRLTEAINMIHRNSAFGVSRSDGIKSKIMLGDEENIQTVGSILAEGRKSGLIVVYEEERVLANGTSMIILQRDHIPVSLDSAKLRSSVISFDNVELEHIQDSRVSESKNSSTSREGNVVPATHNYLTSSKLGGCNQGCSVINRHEIEPVEGTQLEGIKTRVTLGDERTDRLAIPIFAEGRESSSLIANEERFISSKERKSRLIMERDDSSSCNYKMAWSVPRLLKTNSSMRNIDESFQLQHMTDQRDSSNRTLGATVQREVDDYQRNSVLSTSQKMMNSFDGMELSKMALATKTFRSSDEDLSNEVPTNDWRDSDLCQPSTSQVSRWGFLLESNEGGGVERYDRNVISEVGTSLHDLQNTSNRLSTSPVPMHGFDVIEPNGGNVVFCNRVGTSMDKRRGFTSQQGFKSTKPNESESKVFNEVGTSRGNGRNFSSNQPSMTQILMGGSDLIEPNECEVVSTNEVGTSTDDFINSISSWQSTSQGCKQGWEPNDSEVIFTSQVGTSMDDWRNFDSTQLWAAQSSEQCFDSVQLSDSELRKFEWTASKNPEILSGHWRNTISDARNESAQFYPPFMATSRQGKRFSGSSQISGREKSYMGPDNPGRIVDISGVPLQFPRTYAFRHWGGCGQCNNSDVVCSHSSLSRNKAFRYKA